MLLVKIRVKGSINKDWSEWFDGLQIAHAEDDETILSGLVKDQAALYGLLTKLWNLKLSLVAVTCSEEEPRIEEKR